MGQCPMWRLTLLAESPFMTLTAEVLTCHSHNTIFLEASTILSRFPGERNYSAYFGEASVVAGTGFRTVFEI